MQDVSISRPRKNLSWGVPVPDDPEQIMYVWIDALANYIMVLLSRQRNLARVLPAYVQVIGKDILRFMPGFGRHPTRTRAATAQAPTVHGHINVNGAKMSKSVGNVVDPNQVIDEYGLMPFAIFASHIQPRMMGLYVGKI